MAIISDNIYQSCSDDRFAEIIFKEGNLAAFNGEFWRPETKKYEDFRHEKVMESLRRATRHHLKGNFTDDRFSDGDDNILTDSFE